jgi:protein SCO1/2
MLSMISAVAGCGSAAPARELVGYRPTGPQPVSALSLPDATRSDAPFHFTPAADHVLVTYFGYTSCPDVCPTTLANLKQAIQGLGADGERVEVAMATIDPTRDSAEVISGYVRSFVADAHALRTEDDAALRQVTDRFGVSYRVSVAADGTEDVSHSGSTFVVGPSGSVVLTWAFGVSAADMRDDLRQMLREAATA